MIWCSLVTSARRPLSEHPAAPPTPNAIGKASQTTLERIDDPLRLPLCTDHSTSDTASMLRLRMLTSKEQPSLVFWLRQLEEIGLGSTLAQRHGRRRCTTCQAVA